MLSDEIRMRDINAQSFTFGAPSALLYRYHSLIDESAAHDYRSHTYPLLVVGDLGPIVGGEVQRREEEENHAESTRG